MFIAEYLYPLLEMAASILAIIFYALNKPTFLIFPQKPDIYSFTNKYMCFIALISL